MTFPVLESSTVTTITTYTPTPSIDLPATVDEGDHLIALAAFNRSTPHYVVPTSSFNGWEQLFRTNLHGYHSWHIYHKVADGDEDGGTVGWAASDWVIGGGVVLRISGAYDGGKGVGVAIAYDSSRSWSFYPNPPQVTAPWGSADNLFIAAMTAGNTGAAVSSYPADYSGGAAVAKATDITITGAAVRQLAAASDNPGQFELDDSENWWSATIVVRPADSTATLNPPNSIESGLDDSGLLVAGQATGVSFTDPTSNQQVPSDIAVLWDFDNDGDFDEDDEDITGLVLSAEVVTGRDFPSQLTGKTTPGTFRAVLRNDDDRFWPTNLDSPLNSAPFSLDIGRKLRVRTTDATDPEPTLLLSDRMGTSGDMAATEQDEPWGPVIGSAWTVADDAATPNEAGESIIIADAGATEHYLQARWRHCDSSNGIGIVYRFQNNNNYGLLWLQDGTLTHTVVSSGSATDHGSQTIETRPHMSFGVRVTADDDVTVYLEGVPLWTDTGDAAGTGTGGTGVGAWVDWDTHRAPSLEEIHAWDDVWSTSPGVLFTGDVAEVMPLVTAGPQKTVQVRAVGWLARAAGPDVLPPTSIGQTTESPAGVTTGLMVGQTLASAGMLHPPPPGGIAEGSQLGGVGSGTAKALFIARLFEAAEGPGFLYEEPEGPVGFADGDARIAREVIAAISDQPGSQFTPEVIEPLDWRREVFNRVQAEVAVDPPVIETTLTQTGNHGSGATAEVTVTMPTSGQADDGDLILVLIVAACTVENEAIEAPTGWVALGRGVASGLGKERWFARRATAGVLDGSVTFYEASTAGGGAWLARTWVISNWYGAVESGVAVSEPAGETGTTAQAGAVEPPTLLVPWGRQPNLYLATRSGMYTSSSGSVSGTDPDDAPNSYRGLDSDAVAATVATADVGNQWAWTHAVSGIEGPSAFGGTFTGFDYVESSTVAIRGYSGSPPAETGGEVVEVDDLASQATHNVVSTFPDVPRFFPSAAAAETYAEGVLAYYASSKPLFRVGFHASKSALYRYLASTVRVSDLLRINATGTTGIGVNGLYFVESIRHAWDNGTARWWWEAELSPSE